MPTTLAANIFVRYGTSHSVVLALAVLAAVAVVQAGKRLRWRARLKLARLLAVLVAADMVGEYTWRFCTGYKGTWQENLPLHFCSIMAILSVIALWWRRRWACAAVYFGVLTASIQGLLTPALQEGFPETHFFLFFLSHSLLLLVAVAIPALLGWRGGKRDVPRSIALMDLYLLCIIPLNVLLGTNYGYTQGSPAEGSLLDFMGPGPWYYLWLQVPAYLVFRFMLLFVRNKNKP